jgi:hypothetical protein
VSSRNISSWSSFNSGFRLQPLPVHFVIFKPRSEFVEVTPFGSALIVRRVLDVLMETDGGSATQNYLFNTLKEYGGEVI